MIIQSKLTRNDCKVYADAIQKLEHEIASKKQQLATLRLDYAQAASDVTIGHTFRKSDGKMLLVTDITVISDLDANDNFGVCIMGKQYKKDGNVGLREGYVFVYYTYQQHNKLQE